MTTHDKPNPGASYDPTVKQKAAAKLSRIPIKVQPGEILKKPDWIRVKAGSPSTRFYEIKDVLRSNKLVTVCEEASCPNIGECFGKGTATFMIMGAIMGAHVVTATPEGKWAPNAAVVAEAREIAKTSGATIEVLHDPEVASQGASVLYTDVWMSMGDPEAERAEKMKVLQPFAVTSELMKLTEKDSIFMHCLPAHRGEEVSAEVIDGPRSVVWREAHHRRTTIQALLYHLVRGEIKGR